MQLPKYTFIWFPDCWKYETGRVCEEEGIFVHNQRKEAWIPLGFLMLPFLFLHKQAQKHKGNLLVPSTPVTGRRLRFYFVCGGGKTGRDIINTIWEETGWGKWGLFAASHYLHIKLHSNFEGLLRKAGGEKWKLNCVASKGNRDMNKEWFLKRFFLCRENLFPTYQITG